MFVSRPWFVPKQYGYGATPSTWEGWLATLLFVLLVTLTSTYLTNEPNSPAHLLGLDRLPILRDLRPTSPEVLAAMLLEVGGFLLLVRWKTSGPWRWRKGGSA